MDLKDEGELSGFLSSSHVLRAINAVEADLNTVVIYIGSKFEQL